MTQDEIRYWEAAVQLIPVVMLAVVIEARTTSRRWTQATPLWNRILDGTLWVVVILGLGYSEALALQGVQGKVVDQTDVRVTSVIIVFGFVVLVVVAAVEILMRGYAELTAWLVSRHPRSRLTAAIDDLQIRRALKRNEKGLADMQAMKDDARENLDFLLQMSDQVDGELRELESQEMHVPNGAERLAEFRAQADHLRDVVVAAERKFPVIERRAADAAANQLQLKIEIMQRLKNAPARRREQAEKQYTEVLQSLLPPNSNEHREG